MNKVQSADAEGGVRRKKHWHAKVEQLRTDVAEEEEKSESAPCPHYQEQRVMCRTRNLKSQKESLLLLLQLSTQKGLISPLPFVPPGDDSELPKLNTLYHLFRRSGLVPED